ncbi:PKD domain-containing protein [Candidatus Peregrinibacteria bacterium]|jgi:PKD repeat protein|nr:PKD domain-containing protein [Candidatus Peregrinibacteria bacterium]
MQEDQKPFTDRVNMDQKSEETQNKEKKNPFQKLSGSNNQIATASKKHKRMSLWLALVILFFASILLLVFLIFVLSVGGANNPVLQTFGIDPFFLKESLISLTNASFGFITAILFLILLFGIFRAILVKKDDSGVKKFSLILSAFSFGMMFLSILVWLGVFNFISTFVVNAEPPAAQIEYHPTQKEILEMKSPVEITLSAAQAKTAWERKRKGITSFAWDLNNDGDFEFRTQDLEFVQEFNQSGDITVRLMIQLDDGTQDIVEKTISLPAAVFAYSPKNGPVPLKVEFDASVFNSPRNPIVEYAWDFDEDGSFDLISDKSRIDHIFTRIGSYDVLLRTKTITGSVKKYNATIQAQGGVNAVEHFSARITASPSLEGIAPLSIRFSAEESISPYGDITSYDWDFGDNTFKEKGKTVDHTFVDPGKYTLTLNLEDSEGNTVTTTETIIVNSESAAPSPVIRTSPEILQGSAPFTVEFDASASVDKNDSIVEYGWDYDGDGIADIKGQKFTHIFREDAEYTVTLMLTDSSGLSSKEEILVTVSGKDLLADITANPDSGAIPLVVDFDASASYFTKGKIVSYEWDFGDGSLPQLAGAQKSHRYNQVGVYDVILKIFTDDGQTSETTMKIFARNLPTQACYTVSRHEGIAPLSVNFDSACSVGNISTWRWDFGDGSTSKDRKPLHIFESAGTYEVILEIVDNANNVSRYSDTLFVN